MSLSQWLTLNEPEFRKSRLPSLYSDLSQLRATNPDGFLANATAWASALTHASLAGQLPLEQKIMLNTSSQLLETLRDPIYGSPTGLGHVIDHAISSGRVMPLSDFMTSENSIRQKQSWLPTPLSILQWTLRKVGIGNTSYDSNGNLKDGKLVIIDNLEMLSQYVVLVQQKYGNSYPDRVISKTRFAEYVAETSVGALTDPEIDVLLRFMSRDRGILMYRDQTVKFQRDEVTDEDMQIAEIKALIGSLESVVEKLSNKVVELQNMAQEGVREKNRHKALSALRSKKRAEEALEMRTKSLGQVQDVFQRIEQAVDQEQVVRVMQGSMETLRSLNQRVGGVERVDGIMDDLREEMKVTDEVGQVLSENLTEEKDVDEELEVMEREEREKREAVEAEKTRERLDELNTPTEKDELEESLSSSAARLQALQLDDEKNAEKIPQPAT